MFVKSRIVRRRRLEPMDVVGVLCSIIRFAVAPAPKEYPYLTARRRT